MNHHLSLPAQRALVDQRRRDQLPRHAGVQTTSYSRTHRGRRPREATPPPPDLGPARLQVDPHPRPAPG